MDVGHPFIYQTYREYLDNILKLFTSIKTRNIT